MQRPHRAAHALVWRVLVVALPALLVGAMIVRQDGPHERVPQRLDAPGEAPGDAAAGSAPVPPADGAARPAAEGGGG